MRRWMGMTGEYCSKLSKLLKSKKYYFETCDSSILPRAKGIYMIYHKGHSKKPLYAGIAQDLKRRITHQHPIGCSQFGTYCGIKINKRRRKSISKYTKRNCFFKFMPYRSKKLECLEHFAIAVLRPKWMI